MATPNYSQAKKQREMQKQQKKQEKQNRKASKNATGEPDSPTPAATNTSEPAR
jgi:hypothetical protein